MSGRHRKAPLWKRCGISVMDMSLRFLVALVVAALILRIWLMAKIERGD